MKLHMHIAPADRIHIFVLGLRIGALDPSMHISEADDESLNLEIEELMGESDAAAMINMLQGTFSDLPVVITLARSS